MDGAFDDIEEADLNQYKDSDFVGIYGDPTSALNTAEHGTYLGGVPDLTVDVNFGTAYSKSGQRLNVATPQNVDVSQDYLSVPTSPPSGDEKVVSIFLKFLRIESDPRTDGNNVSVNFQQLEGFELEVRQGTAVTPPTDPFTTAPAFDADAILIADIVRKNPQATIVDADIDPVGTRREAQFSLSAGAFSVEEGTVERALQALLDEINTIATGGASGIGYTDGSGGWADASGIAATDVQAAIDEIVDDLADATATDGAGKVGYDNTATATAWADGSGLAAGTVAAAIDEIVTDLGGSTGSGAVGHAQTQQWADLTAPTAGDINTVIENIVSDLADTAAGDDGAGKVGFDNTGGNFTSSDVRNAIEEAGGLAHTNVWTANNTWQAQMIHTNDSGSGGAPSGAFTGFSNSWAQASVRTAGSGTVELATLVAAAVALEAVGLVEVYAVSWFDDDEGNSRAHHSVCQFGRPTAGSTTINVFSEDESDKGTPNVTDYSYAVVSNDVRFRATMSGAQNENHLIMWRLFLADGNQ